MKEFTLNTVMELEKKTTAAATRAAAAEEQLDELQKYMSQSTVTYQKVQRDTLLNIFAG
jgi:hypothetical protein